MRATEFIRGLLDLIDQVDGQEQVQQPTDYKDEVDIIQSEEDCSTQFSNSPDEMYTDEKVLFSIGNDINKPKHPSDLRTDSFSLYPNMQYKSGK
jgi:hypothetical protein